jgi:transcriptional regulator with XRE-family HTH domain
MDETFGQALRRIRSAREAKQADIGRLVNYTDKYMSDLERGRRRPHRDLAAALDRALDADGLLIELAAQVPGESIGAPWTAQTAQDVLARIVESALMDRRGFLILSGSATTGLALTWSATEAAPLTVAAGGWVTAEAVDHLQNRIEELWLLDDLIGGGGCLDAGVADLRLVDRLVRHGRYGDEVGRRLYSLAAALARFCGWAAFDGGREAAAQRFWHAGLRLAAAAGDCDQGVYILSNLALQSVYADDGDSAVALLDIARRRVDPAARTVLAMLDTWSARAHAVAGDDKAAATLLNLADDLWSNRRIEDDPTWVYWLPQPSLTAEAGTALMDIGDLAAAERSLRAGLATLDDNSMRERNLYLVRLAEVQLRGDRLDEAALTAQQAIDVAAHVDSARVHADVDRLLGEMPAGEPVTAQVRDFRHERLQGR